MQINCPFIRDHLKKESDLSETPKNSDFSETPKNIEIQLSEDLAQGVFANLAIINHTDSEFVLDFVYLQPNTSKGKVRSRVIMTPSHLKQFLLALQDNFTKFEARQGLVKTASKASSEEIQTKS